MNCFDVMSKAVEIYRARDTYAYFYGAKGQILTDERMKALWNALYDEHFHKYNEREKREIFEFSRGRTGIDCSGLINLCTGQVNWSTGYYEASLNKTDPISGTWGNLLYTTHGGTGRHVGLDMGEGRFLHAPKEMHTVELGIIRLYDWEASGQIAGIDYTLTGNK